GVLLSLYGIASIAYVGGGFGEGVHSVLEPAAYGIPVLCGPRIERSRDAEEMAREGALHVIRAAEELQQQAERLLSDRKLREEEGKRTGEFVKRRTGATERIISSMRNRGLPL